ncbi:MAG: septum formation initiator family protein [Pseudomonadota bacterium]|nr:septum formation initiator family protein [Pseudomonadota bacterium]
MGLWSYIVAKCKSSGFIVLLMVLCSYFSYFAVKGDRGFLKYMYLQDKIAEATKVKADYEEQRQNWDQKVKLLSKSSLDLDLLDERARAVLNFIGNDEFIILDDEDNG